MVDLVPPAALFFLGALAIGLLPRRLGPIVMLVVPVVALGHVLALTPDTTLDLTFYGLEIRPLRVDRLGLAFAIIFCIASFLSGLFGWRTMARDERMAALAYAGSAVGVVLAGDLLTLFVFWELKALTSSAVVLLRRSPTSGPAGMRYLYVQLVSGKLLLAGAVWHMAETGSLLFGAFDASGATLLIGVSFLMAAAVPPLHAWLPDAYPQASVAGTVFLSAFTTKAAVYALARGFAGYEILVWLGVVMALYGVVYAVLENDIRRLLGYHIISQVGYMVAAVGIGTEMAINGATAHAFAHILYKGLLLMGAGAVLQATGRSLATQLGGIAHKMPAVVILYFIGAVSISSFPLFSGFVSKELVVEAASLDGRAVLVILLKIASVGTFLHTGLKLPYNTFFGPRRDIDVRPIPGTMYAAMGLAALANLAIGVQPWLLYDLLPFAVDYQPYSLGKVVETSQLLLFTGMGFWLLLTKLGAEPRISLDTDWVYRTAPRRAAVLAGRLRPARDAAPAAPRPGIVTRLPVLGRAPIAGGVSPVYPTWMLGASIIAVFAFVLGLAYLS